MEGTGGRATTAFIRQLTRMFDEVPEIIWDRGAIIIPDPARLEKVLPRYYKTSKFSSFQRQLNNFGYHRSYSANERLNRSKSRGVCYHKVAGAPLTKVEGLLSLRPLVRRKKRELTDNSEEDEPPHRRMALSGYRSKDSPFRTESDSSLDGDDEKDLMKLGAHDPLSLADAARCLVSMNDAAHSLLVVNQRPRQWI